MSTEPAGDPLVALFDRLLAAETADLSATTADDVVAGAEAVLRGELPQVESLVQVHMLPQDAVNLPPGHWGPGFYDDPDDAIAEVEEEGAEMYAEVYELPDGTYGIYYFDNTGD